jgi:hypothetical protein
MVWKIDLLNVRNPILGHRWWPTEIRLTVPLLGFQEGVAYLLNRQLDQGENPRWHCTYKRIKSNKSTLKNCSLGYVYLIHDKNKWATYALNFISLPKVQPFLPEYLVQSLRLVHTLLVNKLLGDCNSYVNKSGSNQSNHYITTSQVAYQWNYCTSSQILQEWLIHVRP